MYPVKRKQRSWTFGSFVATLETNFETSSSSKPSRLKRFNGWFCKKKIRKEIFDFLKKVQLRFKMDFKRLKILKLRNNIERQGAQMIFESWLCQFWESKKISFQSETQKILLIDIKMNVESLEVVVFGKTKLRKHCIRSKIITKSSSLIWENKAFTCVYAVEGIRECECTSKFLSLYPLRVPLHE